MPKGRIVSWNDERGFGHIGPNGGGANVFVHVSDLLHRNYRPKIGDSVRFAISRDNVGRPRASNVTIRGVPKHYRSAPWSLALIVPALFLGLLVGAGADGRILVGYAAVSAVTWLAYFIDKRRSRAKGQRTPESTLQMLALAGGWPGAVLAQQTLRHKTRKPFFQTVFWLIVAIHLGLWTFLWLTGQPLEALLRQALQVG